MNDLAKERMGAFEIYLRDCLTKITSASSGKKTRTTFFLIQALPVWGSQKHQIKSAPMKGKWDTQSVIITKAGIQKSEKLGPNSIFYFSNYLR